MFYSERRLSHGLERTQARKRLSEPGIESHPYAKKGAARRSQTDAQPRASKKEMGEKLARSENETYTGKNSN
ncbi:MULTISPECIES: hypothetical protein [Gammaproteobacteria]|nr:MULTISPECIES: hypothetical protein [Gammaproteobacteria]MDX7527633.1 hypothetical protein [Enterobacter hormaechei]BDC88246.1 hypothetical protein NUITMVA2_36030 [Aeromonas caviae]